MRPSGEEAWHCAIVGCCHARRVDASMLMRSMYTKTNEQCLKVNSALVAPSCALRSRCTTRSASECMTSSVPSFLFRFVICNVGPYGTTVQYLIQKSEYLQYVSYSASAPVWSLQGRF